MSHNRLFVASGVALVKEQMKHHGKALIYLGTRMEELLKEQNFFNQAPFKWIGMNLRFGTKNKTVPWYQGMSKKYGDLNIAIELDANILQWLDKNEPDRLKEIFLIATLEALMRVGEKYNLPTQRLEKERAKYGIIPESIEELEADDRR
jgi:hypothetical protein